MTKIFYILIFLIVFVLIGIGITWYVQNNAQSNKTTTVTGSGGYTLPPVGLTTSDFLTAPSVTADTHNPGMYLLGHSFTPDPATGALPAYVITYDAKTKYFNIALLQKPFATSRLAAESYLRTLLKLNDSSLCALSYTVSVPGYVDAAASGIDYRFSFCPGSVQLQ